MFSTINIYYIIINAKFHIVMVFLFVLVLYYILLEGSNLNVWIFLSLFI